MQIMHYIKILKMRVVHISKWKKIKGKPKIIGLK